VLFPIRGERTSGRKAHFIFGDKFLGRLLESPNKVAADADKIREIADRVSARNGVEVVEVELRGGGKARTLKITIDKPEGVTHEDCANVSREVSAILDVEDSVPGGSYTLEVSSPGLDRKLVKTEDYVRFTGSRVKLTTREPVSGNRHFDGRLKSFREGRLILEMLSGKKKPKPGHAQPGQVVEIELANVEKANLVPEI
jgi:ribosome maturation factor RimP